MDEKEMFEGFDESQMEEYREEARQRWGAEIVDESYRRVSKFTKEDWAQIRSEMNEVQQGMAARMDRDPADPEVQELIARYHKVMNRFYGCVPEIFRGLGDLYVEDSRFTAHYDKVKPGLARFMRGAMHVYADRLIGEKGS